MKNNMERMLREVIIASLICMVITWPKGLKKATKNIRSSTYVVSGDNK
jgi:hypothetical protein